MTERYDLTFGSAARRALAEHLPGWVALAVLAFGNGPLRESPHRVGAPLRTPLAGQYSARRGVYRVRYRIDDDRRLVCVGDIAYRS